MDKRTFQTIIILALAIGISIGLFFSFFEKAERTVVSKGSAKARQNPFLAALRFLDTAGIPATGSNQREFLNQLPDVRDLIFIHRPGSNYPEGRINRIAAWVERGGTLVIHHHLQGREKNDPLLEALGLRFQPQDRKKDKLKGNTKTEKQAEPFSDKNARQTDKCKCPEKETLKEVFRGKELALAFDSGRAFPPLAPSSPAIELFRGKKGAHVIRKSVGEGQLIVLSDDRFLTNDGIGENDHAFFLLKLSEGRAHVWILYNSVMPSVFSLVMKKMPLMLMSFLVLMIFAFLYLTRRIGPVYPVHDFSSRNIIEHLLAAGHFVRKHEKTLRQIQSARKALKKKIAARYPYLAKKPRTEQINLIAKWAQMPVPDVLAALEHPVGTTQDYIHTTMRIKTIQDAIAANHKKAGR